MAGGSPEHAALAANVIALLAVPLRGTPCRVFSDDLRVRVKDRLQLASLGIETNVAEVYGAAFASP